MKYLSTEETQKEIFYLASISKEILIISPFINFKRFFSLATAKTIKFLTRFTADTFLNGSSDIEFFEEALKRNFEIKTDANLHAKIYIFDNCVIMGSSNLTYSGLKSNLESNVKLTEEDIDYSSFRKKVIDLYLMNKNIVTENEIIKIKKQIPFGYFKKKYIEKNISSINCKMVVLPHLLENDIKNATLKCFCKNENTFALGEQIKEDLKKSNYRHISFDSYIKLYKWIHPKSEESKCKNTAPEATKLSNLLFGYTVPFEIDGIKLRQNYINQDEKKRIKLFHEKTISF